MVKKKNTLKFSTTELDRIIVSLLHNGSNKKFATNVQRLFNLYEDQPDYEKQIRTWLISQIVDIILKNDITETESIISFIDYNGMYGDKVEGLVKNLSTAYVPENEVALLDKKISQQLKYNAIVDNAEEITEMLSNIQSETYSNLEDAVTDLEIQLDKVNREIKSARESVESSKKDMNLSSDGFIGYLGKVIEKEKNPSTRIKTGSQYMNAMLGGGFEKGRLYVALGVAKGWKSGFLLSTAIWAKKYNTLTTHDPRLKPVIVYLSMENTNDETLIRLWNNQFGDQNPITNYDAATAARMLQSSGVFTPNEPNSPEILLWYRPNRSISTIDLSIMLDDLKKEGRECVLLVLDYLKRIRPAEVNKDIRLELGNITNELKTIAMEQDIPVVSAMQLNREAFRQLEDSTTFEEKLRASDRLGASNVGESIDIIQNADYSFIVNKMERPQYNDDGDLETVDRYLFVKLIASRAKQPAITSFKHRFKDGNGMALDDDIGARVPNATREDSEFIKRMLQNNPNGPKTSGPRRAV